MKTSFQNVTIEDACREDFAVIRDIYAYYVENTTVSLEESAPDTEEMIARWKISLDKSLPYLVAKINNKVVGYAYAVPYRPRTAYRFTVEESVYISKDFHGCGIGYRLLSELINKCSEKGYKQMLAVIAGQDNTPSIKFHQNMGFYQAGILRNFGFKFEKWIDSVLMQKEL